MIKARKILLADEDSDDQFLYNDALREIHSSIRCDKSIVSMLDFKEANRRLNGF